MTKITNIKNDIPIYVEQKFIQTDLQASDILKTRTLIPSNFIGLEMVEGNYICSTNPKWKNKPLCERYGFSNQAEWIYLDIPHALMEKLDLEKGEDIPNPVYISPAVLKRKAAWGGITIQNEQEIFIERPFQKNQSTQTENASEINKVKLLLAKTQNLRTEKKRLLIKISEAKKEDNLNQQTILNLQGELADLEEKLTKLETELVGQRQQQTQLQKDWTHRETNYQTQINNLQQEITQLNNTLQTTQQEKDRIQQSLKRSWLSFLFKDKQKRQRIKELNNSLAFLRGLLRDKNQQVNNLVAERNNLQNQINDLNRQLNGANNLIADRDNEIDRLENRIRRIEEERDKRPNITPEQWDNDYSQRPTQQKLNDLQTELDNTKRELDNYRREWDGHECMCCEYCYLTHY